MWPNNELTIAFEATVRATEEAIVNAMAAAETTVGVAGFTVREMPEETVRAIFSE